MDFYEDERDSTSEDERNTKDEYIIKLNELSLSIPKRIIEERINIMHMTTEDILQDMKSSALACYKNCLHLNYPIEKIPDKILEHFESEMDIYR